MKKYLRRFRNIFFILFLLIMLLLRIGHTYETRNATDKNVVKKLSQRSDNVQIGKYMMEGESVRYAEIGNNKNPTLIFIHGAPGSLASWYSLIEKTNISKKYHILLVDRPGYGRSYHGHAVTSLEKQAKMLAPLLALNQHKINPIIIGRSFGGPIVAKLLFDYPTQISGAIIVAGAVDPEHEIVWKITYPMERKFIRWMIPPGLRVTNREKLTHITELKKLQPEWRKITHPLTVMHGKPDWIVPVENAYFIEKHALHADLKMIIDEKQSHITTFQKPEILTNEIEQLYEKIETSASSPQTYKSR